MKLNLFLIVLFWSSMMIGQYSNFQKGYSRGYKEGFCYQKIGCIEPVSPISPIPTINENYKNFKDGYQRGFLDGKIKNEKQTNESQNYERNYTPRNRNISNDWTELNKTQDQKLDVLRNQNLGSSSLRNFESFFNNTLDRIRESNMPQDDKRDIIDGVISAVTRNIPKMNMNDSRDVEELMRWIEDDVVPTITKNHFSKKNKSEAYTFKNPLARSNMKDFDFRRSKKQTPNLSEENYKSYSTEEKNNSDLWSKAQNSMYNSKNYLDAIFFSSQIIASKNSDNLASVYFLRAQAYNKYKDYQKSNKDFEYIINNSDELNYTGPRLGTVYNNIAWNYILMKKYPLAKPYIEKALTLDNTKSYIWDTKGELEYHNGNYSESILAMNKAISIDSNSTNSLLYRGLSNIKVGKKSNGCSDLKFASDYGNSEAAEHYKKLCN